MGSEEHESATWFSAGSRIGCRLGGSEEPVTGSREPEELVGSSEELRYGSEEPEEVELS